MLTFMYEAAIWPMRCKRLASERGCRKAPFRSGARSTLVVFPLTLLRLSQKGAAAGTV